VVLLDDERDERGVELPVLARVLLA